MEPAVYKISKLSIPMEIANQVIEAIFSYKLTGSVLPKISYTPKQEEITIAYCDCSDADLKEGFDGRYIHKLNLIMVDEESEDYEEAFLHEVIHFFQYKLYKEDEFEEDVEYDERWYEIQAKTLARKFMRTIHLKECEETIICDNDYEANAYYENLFI